MVGFVDMQNSSKTDVKYPYPSLTELYRHIVMYTVYILYITICRSISNDITKLH